MDINELVPWLFGAGWFVVAAVIVLCSTVPFLVIFGGLGYYFYNASQKSKLEKAASLSWRQAYGEVIKSRVEVSGGDMTTVKPRIVYTYEVHGRRYQSEQIRAGDRFMSLHSSRDAYDLVDRYPAGARVTVFYNPADPTQAVLER